ncbi:hypothetical protein BDQ17DRAFT_1428514 [Cyathus striatus]|nr:hypothetical protein BDQ17DRAFT_1428514 [Cyathus striatus]
MSPTVFRWILDMLWILLNACAVACGMSLQVVTTSKCSSIAICINTRSSTWWLAFTHLIPLPTCVATTMTPPTHPTTSSQQQCHHTQLPSSSLFLPASRR